MSGESPDEFLRKPLLGRRVNKGKKKGRGRYTPAPSRALGLLALYLKEANFVPLHTCYLSPASLRRLSAQSVSCLLAGTHGFFAFPEG